MATISEVTRRNLFDALRVQGTGWAGRLQETEFLGRIWNLADLPSHDPRHKDASGDIWRHRVLNPDDWPDDWIYSDSLFNLLRCDDEIFLRFLCEMIHPVVRPESQEVQALLHLFNDALASDQFEMVERARISGRPVFAPRVRVAGTPPSVALAKSVVQSFDAEYMSRQLARLESSIPHDPDLAIGTAKELVETCCKTILAKLGCAPSKGIDLPQLVKAVCKELKMAPGDISDSAKGAETIRRLLSNLSTVTQGLAELRNDYGTGHGKTGGAKGLGSRHAKLAAGAATTLTIFLFETYQERILGVGG
jgi:hypothetical protein